MSVTTECQVRRCLRRGLQPALEISDLIWILWMHPELVTWGVAWADTGPLLQGTPRCWGEWRPVTSLGTAETCLRFVCAAGSVVFCGWTCLSVAVHNLPLAWLGREQAQPWSRHPNSLLCLCGGSFCCELDKSRSP